MKPSRIIAATTAAALAALGAACSDEPDDGRVHLTVAMDAGLEQGAIDAFNERIAQFEDANPDIDIEAQEYDWTATTFTAQLAGGTLPDVFTIPFTDGRGLIERGQIADISSLTAELPYADSFNPNVAAAGSDGEGNLWAVPTAAYGQGLHYNRSLFEAAGLDPDAPPQTWDEVREAADAIAEETGETGYAQMTNGNTGGWILTTMVYALGGRTESADGGTATIDTPQMREALEMLRTMRWEDGSMGDNFLYDWGTVNQDFASGRIGMYISGGDVYTSLFTQNDLDPAEYGLTALPLDGADSGVLGGGTLAAVSPNTEADEQAAAVEWIDFYFMEKLTDETAAVADAETLADSGQPVGAPELPVFDQATYDQSLEWVAEYVNVPVDQMTPYTDRIFDQPLLPEPATATQEVYAVLDSVVQTVLTDEGADVGDLLAQAETDAQAAMDAAS